MGDLYTNGHITVADTRLAALVTAANARFGDYRPDDDSIGAPEDLARLLIESAGGNDEPESTDMATIERNNDSGATTIAVTVVFGDVDDQWRQVAHLLAEHGAEGEFTHEPNDGSSPFRTRLSEGQVHEDNALHHVFAGDIIGHVGQLGKTSGTTLDFLTPTLYAETDVVGALLAELHTRRTPHPPGDTDSTAREQLDNWTQLAGISWAIHPVTAP
ncbi:hypothetical protein [Nocardia noduli]|uniref:hypothetical protein n=1 Tax=Nocardia noduli TaxID=2815722 RepID=UPI001C249B8A|nr:hypothetical protein [Nocardia noduli]